MNSTVNLVKIALLSSVCVWTFAAATGHDNQSVPVSRLRGLTIGLVDNIHFRRIATDVVCGCVYYPPDQKPDITAGNWKYLLVADTKFGWMNINDRDVRLRLIKDGVNYDGKSGDRFTQTYKGTVTTAYISAVNTKVSEDHSLECDAEITVVRGNQRKLVKAVGYCDCE